jgi:hypothetical protein
MFEIYDDDMPKQLDAITQPTAVVDAEATATESASAAQIGAFPMCPRRVSESVAPLGFLCDYAPSPAKIEECQMRQEEDGSVGAQPQPKRQKTSHYSDTEEIMREWDAATTTKAEDCLSVEGNKLEYGGEDEDSGYLETCDSSFSVASSLGYLSAGDEESRHTPQSLPGSDGHAESSVITLAHVLQCMDTTQYMRPQHLPKPVKLTGGRRKNPKVAIYEDETATPTGWSAGDFSFDGGFPVIPSRVLLPLDSSKENERSGYYDNVIDRDELEAWIDEVEGDVASRRVANLSMSDNLSAGFPLFA